MKLPKLSVLSYLTYFFPAKNTLHTLQYEYDYKEDRVFRKKFLNKLKAYYVYTAMRKKPKKSI